MPNLILYVESNFILELAFRQEDYESCENILGLAEAGKIDLLLPAYCLGEPYERLVRRDRQRREVHRKLSEELRELARSAPYTEAAANLSDLTGLLVESGEQEMSQLNALLVRLLDIAKLIPLDRDVLRNALQAQHNLGLSPQDSIVYASVHSKVVVANAPQCFVNKNTRDYLIPEIVEDFEAHNCRLIGKFSDSLNYARSVLTPDNGEDQP
ncbi:MAG: PIN domain-containing protein [Pseudomonadota bacterium]